MIDHRVDRLLVVWGAWVRRENRATNGYALMRYAERIQRSQSADEFGQMQVDPDVLELDKLIRVHLAPLPRQMVVERYANQTPDGYAARMCRISRSEYNKLLNRAVLPQLRHLWDVMYGTPKYSRQPVDADDVSTVSVGGG